MTIRDRVIQTGNIALPGDLFRFAEPGAWIRAPTSPPIRSNAALAGLFREAAEAAGGKLEAAVRAGRVLRQQGVAGRDEDRAA